MALPASICVYCGSSANVGEPYRRAAESIGRLLGEQRIRVIYGGGRVGLMGLVADSALAAGGEVIGIIPRHIQDMEVAHRTLTELHVVETMHERKRMMVDRAQAFVILPGGLGTLDETFEILTWKQLGLHNRPIVLLDTNSYWAPLLALLRHAAAEGFIRPQHTGLFRMVAEVDEVLNALGSTMPGVQSATELM